MRAEVVCFGGFVKVFFFFLKGRVFKKDCAAGLRRCVIALLDFFFQLVDDGNA